MNRTVKSPNLAVFELLCAEPRRAAREEIARHSGAERKAQVTL